MKKKKREREKEREIKSYTVKASLQNNGLILGLLLDKKAATLEVKTLCFFFFVRGGGGQNLHEKRAKGPVNN